MAGGVGRICRKRIPHHRGDDRKNVPCPVHLDGTFENVDPIGIDRWPFELALKYRMRDGYVCPVGGRWAVGFWSPSVLGNSFTQQDRGLLHMAANAAAVRLERLVTDDAKRVGSRACLTAREQSVLRHASVGLTLQEIATALGLAEETVRSHFKKAQAKLGTRNRMHTVAEAMRALLII
jgi:DNA-binding CsgD family transcriptional regulator